MDNWKRDWPKELKVQGEKKTNKHLKVILGSKSDLNISGFTEEIIDPGNMWQEHAARGRANQLTLKEKNSCDEREKDIPEEVMLTKSCYLTGTLGDISWHWKAKNKIWAADPNWEGSMTFHQGREKRSLLCIVNDPTRRWWQALFKLLLVGLVFVARSCDVWDLLVPRSKGSNPCPVQWKCRSIKPLDLQGSPLLVRF